jgi:hypothetical protein
MGDASTAPSPSLVQATPSDAASVAATNLDTTRLRGTHKAYIAVVNYTG